MLLEEHDSFCWPARARGLMNGSFQCMLASVRDTRELVLGVLRSCLASPASGIQPAVFRSLRAVRVRDAFLVCQYVTQY